MFTSVFLTSLSAIAFEILLTRLFSISQWHHLSFMVISIALFGMAASGTYLGIAGSRGKRWHMQHSRDRWMVRLSFCYVISALLSFLLVRSLPLDYYKLPFQPMQALYLMITYLSLAIPFFFTGLIVAHTYISIPEKTGLIYFMNMAGSALGALIPMVLLKPLGEGKLMILVAILPLLVCFSFLNRTGRTDQRPVYSSRAISNGLVWTGIALFGICLASIILLNRTNPLFNIPISEYKALHQLLQFPDSQIISSTTGITGRIDTVRSPFLRFSPGLSLQYTGKLPQQFALFKDGDGRQVFYDASHRNGFLFATYSLPYAGYLLAPKNANVLIIQDGGGSAIPCALSSDPREITVIEKHPLFAEMIGRHYQIPVVSHSPTMFLARESNRFDIIHLEDWGSSLPGTAALSLDHLLTIESLQAYLEHLTEAGILILSRKLILPPSNMVRIAAAAHEALGSLQVADPQSHIAILRNWDTFTFLLSKKKIQHLDILKTFASEKNFDLVWPQSGNDERFNHFNKFEEPYYADAVQSLFTAFANGMESRFFRDYPLDIAPQTDNRPFPDKFFKWRKARTIHHMTGSRLYTLLLSGEIIIAIVFIEAMVIAGLLLLGPLWLVRRHTAKPSFHSMAYFTGIGSGFILVEIYFIHYYTRIFNDPVLSFSLVLTTVLISSSIGGLISQRLRPALLKSMLAIVGLLLLLMLFWFDPLIETIIRLPSHFCLILSTLLIIPVGILLGFPFPMGMRYLVSTPAHRAYAWATNGSASVLAAIMATQMAISWGLTTLLWCAVVTYGMAWGALIGYKGLETE
jgi:hypothetical protein